MAERPKSYKDLLVWQKSMAMVKLIYELTRNFPQDERFGLVIQMRRAAVSVPSTQSQADAILSLIDESQRMLNGLRQKLATCPSSLATHA
jgi:23S rRNA-intervening sequence protein